MLWHYKEIISLACWLCLPPLWESITLCSVPTHQKLIGCAWYDRCLVLILVLQQDQLTFLSRLNFELQLQKLSRHVWHVVQESKPQLKQEFLNCLSGSSDLIVLLKTSPTEVKILQVHIENPKTVTLNASYWQTTIICIIMITIP